MDHIHFILTGGTIAKSYNPSTEKPELTDENVVPGYLADKIKPHIETTFETLCWKDSWDFTDEDRQEMTDSIQACDAQKIIIVHGTSTMTETLNYVKLNGGGIDKVVILTGAMIPLKEFAMSDAGFNLGFAMASAMHLSPGLYICMNGKCFSSDTAQKNINQARFED